MNSEQADRLIEDWAKIAGRHALEDGSYARFRQVVRLMIPDTVIAVGAAHIDDVPCGLALDENGLYVVNVSAGRRVGVVRNSVTSNVLVSVVDDYAGPVGTVPAHIREWVFSWPGGKSIAFRGIVRSHNGWDEGPDSAEQMAEAIARATGWMLPGARHASV